MIVDVLMTLLNELMVVMVVMVMLVVVLSMIALVMVVGVVGVVVLYGRLDSRKKNRRKASFWLWEEEKASFWLSDPLLNKSLLKRSQSRELVNT